MKRRNVDDDPILDANHLMGMIGLSMLSMSPLLVVSALGWPIWVALPIGLAVGFAAAPLHRRSRRRLEAARPSARAALERRAAESDGQIPR